MTRICDALHPQLEDRTCIPCHLLGSPCIPLMSCPGVYPDYEYTECNWPSLSQGAGQGTIAATLIKNSIICRCVSVCLCVCLLMYVCMCGLCVLPLSTLSSWQGVASWLCAHLNGGRVVALVFRLYLTCHIWVVTISLSRSICKSRVQVKVHKIFIIYTLI